MSDQGRKESWPLQHLDDWVVLLTIADDRLTLRLTRGVGRVEPQHLGPARAISAVVQSHGAVAGRALAHAVQPPIAAHPANVDVGL